MSSAATDVGETTPDFTDVFEAQQAYFESGDTLTLEYRLRQLRAFDAGLRKHEDALLAAIHADFRKCETEGWVTEMALLYGEIDHMIKGVKKWMKPRSHMVPLALQPSKGVTYAQPLGINLVLGAWNYPVQLSLLPVIGAIAAGNTVVLKPSELAPEASAAIAAFIKDTFEPRAVACVEGGIEESTALLKLPWDHIFYTGGTRVGKIIAKAGAEHLSKVTLELGGKSPTIVMPSANVEVSARRIIWGKMMNAGQTCVAPDYVLVHESVHDRFVQAMQAAITDFYGDDPQGSPDYARIINDRHHTRIAGLIDPAKVAVGGQTDAADRYIAPTILTDVTLDDAVMQEEIFGPVLPVIKVSGLHDVKRIVRHMPNPLALYIFTEDKKDVQFVTTHISYGSGAVNNCMAHLADPNMSFGGIRTSGQGGYHGKHSFDLFSHYKGMLHTSSAKLLDLEVKYPPFGDKLKTLKKLL